MKKILLILLLLTIGCGSYTTTSYRPKIQSILAITEVGDTISVPYRDFIRDKHDTYTRFNYNNNWYWNNWRYDNNWRWNQWWLYSNNGWGNNYYNYNSGSNIPYVKYEQKPKPVLTPTRPKIDKPRVRINNPRGSNSNYRTTSPQRNSTPSRTQTTPNVQTRTNVGRSSNGGRRN